MTGAFRHLSIRHIAVWGFVLNAVWEFIQCALFYDMWDWGFWRGAGYDGAKRKSGSKVHAAVDTLGHLLAMIATPADEQDRAQVEALTAAVQEACGGSVEIAFVDQGYTGDAPAEAAQSNGIELQVVKLPEARRGFVLLPRRWVIERSFAWTTRCRRLVRDYERLSRTLVGLHFLAFACLMLHRLVPLISAGP